MRSLKLCRLRSATASPASVKVSSTRLQQCSMSTASTRGNGSNDGQPVKTRQYSSFGLSQSVQVREDRSTIHRKPSWTEGDRRTDTRPEQIDGDDELPPHESEFDLPPFKRKYKRGVFKEAFYSEPDPQPSEEFMVARLKSALHPPSSSTSGVQSDAMEVLHAAVPLTIKTRIQLIDCHLVDISRILSGHFAQTSLKAIEPPVVQKEASEVIATCFVRQATLQPFRSSQSTTGSKKRNTDIVAENYARYLLHQTLLAKADTGRMWIMLERLEETLKKYQASGSGYRLGPPLTAAWIHLRVSLGVTTRPDFTFIWPSADLVIQYLNDFLKPRGSSAEPYIDGIHQLYGAHPMPDLPATVLELQETLSDFVASGKEKELIDLWRQYRDYIGGGISPNTQPATQILDPKFKGDVLAKFLYALKQTRFGDNYPRFTEQLERSAEELLTFVPKPFPLEIFHTLIAHRSRICDVGPKFETGSDVYAISPNATADEIIEQRIEQRQNRRGSTEVPKKKHLHLQNLVNTWRLAKEQGVTKDIKMYMLYIEGLGRLGDLTGLKEVWNELVNDKDCAKLYGKDRPDGSTHFPPTQALNQMIAATMLVPKIGPPVAFELFEQAAQPESTVPCDIVTINIILRRHARIGDMEGMNSLFSSAASMELKPDVVTFTTLVQGLLRLGDIPGAFRAMDNMHAQGLKPNQHMWAMLVADLSHHGTRQGLEQAENLMSYMRRHKYKDHVHMWTALISGYFRGQWIEDGWDAVRRMEATGLRLNRVGYNVILRQAGESIIEEGRYVEPPTRRIFRKMIKEGIVPNNDTYVIMLIPLIKARLWSDCHEVIQTMGFLGFEPEKKHLKGLLKRVRLKRYEDKWD